VKFVLALCIFWSSLALSERSDPCDRVIKFKNDKELTSSDYYQLRFGGPFGGSELDLIFYEKDVQIVNNWALIREYIVIDTEDFEKAMVIGTNAYHTRASLKLTSCVTSDKLQTLNCELFFRASINALDTADMGIGSSFILGTTLLKQRTAIACAKKMILDLKAQVAIKNSI
jgi:hypothetical protein